MISDGGVTLVVSASSLTDAIQGQMDREGVGHFFIMLGIDKCTLLLECGVSVVKRDDLHGSLSVASHDLR